MESLENRRGDQQVEQPIKQSRRRIVTSCTECNRRKQKACNRAWPCNHCLHRRAVALCRYQVQPRDPVRDVRNAPERAPTAIPTEVAPENEYLGLDEDDSRFLLPHKEEVDDIELTIGTIVYMSYGSNTATNLEKDFQKLLLSEAEVEQQAHAQTLTAYSKDIRRTRNAVMDLLPERRVVDFLVQHFLQEVNWIYETLYPPTFLERYSAWWSQPHYHGMDDIQFGVLIMRTCVLSAIFLPHPKWPTDKILEVPIDIIASRCHFAASQLDNYLPRPITILRVQHLYFDMWYLKQNLRIKQCLASLGEMVKESQELGLHIGNPDIVLTDFEMEMRRRTFWSVYSWDRFMSNFVGGWPLIPEEVVSISLPRELRLAGTGGDVPTTYTDRIIQFKLVRLIYSFKAAVTKDPKSIDAHVDGYTERITKDIINQLPPCLKLDSPDTSFDCIIPSLPLKREALWMAIFCVEAALYRVYFNPFGAQSSSRQIDRKSAGHENVMRGHDILTRKLIKVISATVKIQNLMAGGSWGFNMLSLVAMEGTSVLGMILLSSKLASLAHRSVEVLKHTLPAELVTRAYSTFLEGLELLQKLSERSKIAQKATRVIRPISQRLQTLLDAAATPISDRTSPDVTDTIEQINSANQAQSSAIGDVARMPSLEHNSEGHSIGNEGWSTFDMPIEWTGYVQSPDVSWFLSDDLTTPSGEHVEFQGDYGFGTE